MRAVVQRVTGSSVTVNGEVIGAIEKGLLVLLGVETTDDTKDAAYLAEKIIGLRIFNDSDGKFNLSLNDVNGSVLIVSQFTLLGDCRKGRRPSFIHAAQPDQAIPLYEDVIQHVRNRDITVETGAFGADMKVQLTNDGPVTLLIDSKKDF